MPYAAVNLVQLPEEVSDDQAIMLSDIFPTAYFGAGLAEIDDGDAVAVWGCGPVGQFAVASAKLMGAGRVFAIDRVESRLEMARAQGAEVINFEEEDPTEAIKRLTGGIGVDRAIDAVGVDAETAESGPAAKEAKKQQAQFEQEVLRLIALGHSNMEIAAQLGLSVKTVEAHKANAMQKLDMKGRTDIVSYAILRGWLQNE